MSRSVPSASEAQATFAATLFDEWALRGLRDVVIAPGSRSTPLTLAAASNDELTLHVRLDERSAGFFALGRALATARPVAIVVTSGTAATELHACVAEADLAFVPLIVITADRPPELHGVGAPQTIEQAHLYAKMVRQFEGTYVIDDSASGSWRDLADELWNAATSDSGPGPVHLNVGLVEPLLASAFDLPPRRTVLDAVALKTTLPDIETFDMNGQSILCVVGRGVPKAFIDVCQSLNWVVLGDATAQETLAYFDPILRASKFAETLRPDVVIRAGGIPASKVLNEQLRAWDVETIGLDVGGFIADPDRRISTRYSGSPRHDSKNLRADEDYAARWQLASDAVGHWLAAHEDPNSELSEPIVARAVVDASGETGVPLVVGSSMPVRDVEWWTAPRRSATFANRGVSGIDGVVSTVLGVAAGSRAIGLIGDLTMLHDVSGLVDGLGDAQGSCVLVVVDNRGGGIFSFLPQASALDAGKFERLFATPRTHDLEVVAAAFSHAATTVTTLNDLRRAIEKGLNADGVSVVVAKVPSRTENVDVHQSWNDQVSLIVDGDMA